MDLLNSGLEEFKPGVYLHYKGRLYEADHLMHDANDESRIGVHYIGLELAESHEGPRYAIRTWEDWNGWVHKDGSTCPRYKDGACLDGEAQITPRFRYLGPFYQAAMLAEKHDFRE